jgi:hypothetical protein
MKWVTGQKGGATRGREQENGRDSSADLGLSFLNLGDLRLSFRALCGGQPRMEAQDVE